MRGLIVHKLLPRVYKTHKPLMFYVIDDKPESVARGVYHV